LKCRNIPLRALRPGTEPEFADRMAAAGLLPSATHERVRNIVASPLGDPGVWSHPSKRVWTLTTGARITTSVCAAAASPLQEPAAPVIEVSIRKPGKRQERTGQTTLPNA